MSSVTIIMRPPSEALLPSSNVGDRALGWVPGLLDGLWVLSALRPPSSLTRWGLAALFYLAVPAAFAVIYGVSCVSH